MRNCLYPLVGLMLLAATAHAQPHGDATLLTNDGGTVLLGYDQPGSNRPSGVAVSSDYSTFYVADSAKNAIHVFGTDGQWLFDFADVALVDPAGMALSPADDVLYVCSRGTNTVAVLTAVGDYLFSFTGDGLNAPEDVAVTSDGAVVYVVSRGTGDIKVFDATGGFVFAFTTPTLDLDPTGLALTSDDAYLYVASHDPNRIELFTGPGEYVGTIAMIDTPVDVALTSDDDVLYAVSRGESSIALFDSVGNSLPSGWTPGEVPLSTATELAVVGDDAWLVVTGDGNVPTPGDLNCDGSVDFDDINPFVLAMSSEAAYYAVYPECNWYNADMNGNDVVGFDDINPFVECLVFGECP